MNADTRQVTVVFAYDESLGKWEVTVHNVSDNIEALQAFNSVLLTCKSATPDVRYNKAEPTGLPDEYKISVGV